MKKLIISVSLMLFSVCFASTSATLENITVAKALTALSKKAIETNTTILDKGDNYIKLSFKTSLSDTLLYGSNFNTTPLHSCLITMIQDNKNVLAQVTCQMITNPGSGFQRETAMGKEEEIFSKKLELMFNPHYSYGFAYVSHRKYLRVVDTDPQIISYAEGSEKMEYPDKIIEVNGVPVNTNAIQRLNAEEIYPINQYPDELELKIKNSKNEKEKIVKIKKVLVNPSF